MINVRSLSARAWNAWKRRAHLGASGLADREGELELDALLARDRAEGGDPSPGKPEGDRESVPVDCRKMSPEEWARWKRSKGIW